MCGFAGLFSSQLQHSPELDANLQRMTDALRHRGPDAEGLWRDPAVGVGLGFRRLSFLDLKDTGHQPLRSHCGRFVMVFNGEIYNYRELKAELEKAHYPYGFRGTSDSEVLLAGISHWGWERTLPKLNGMFAIVLWDIAHQEFFLARDRVGEKPLYYGVQKGAFLFGSELKSLMAFSGFQREIDTEALSLHFRYSCIPAPYSIYRGISKLRPGHFLRAKAPFQDLISVPYWSALEVAETGVRDRFTGSFETASQELEKLILDSVRLRVHADVPIGAFLSGGIDSSLVVALTQKGMSRPLPTFTIGFDEAQSDEAPFAAAVARHLGTEHTSLTISPKEAMAVIPELPAMFDEPFADASGIPTFLVAKLARTQVKGALAGDGGDELFGGYNRYLWGERFWRQVGWMPSQVRQGLAMGLRALPLARALRRRALGERLQRVLDVLPEKGPEQLYRALRSHFHPPSQVLRGAQEKPTAIEDPFMEPVGLTYLEKMLFYDLVTFLPDDVLAKLDRTTMRVSLEGRLPLLDHRIIEFAWRLPMDFKLRGKESKRILKDILYRHIPKELVDRPKMGFSVPTGTWLRGGLRDWAEAMLNERRLREDGYLRPEIVTAKWREHQKGIRNWQHQLWDILTFQAWLHRT